jgi:hypothetical protein
VEPDRGVLVYAAMTPDDLRKQASAAEFLASVVSYGRDKATLQAKADALRLQADVLERGGDPSAGNRSIAAMTAQGGLRERS